MQEDMQSSQNDPTLAPLEQSVSSLETEYALLSPAHVANPYSTYARMRKEKPVFFSPFTGSWVVSRYEDVLTILKDPQRFSISVMRMSDDWFTPDAIAVMQQCPFAEVTGLLTVDPPVHTRLRTPVARAMSAQRITSLEPRIRRFANQFIDEFAPETRLDFMERFARPFPTCVIASLMNIPEEDLPQLHQWNSDLSELLTGRPPVEWQVHLAQSYVAIEHYILDLMEQRRQAPQEEDLISDLLKALDSRQASLSILEVGKLLKTLFTAGFVTTVKFLGNALLVLLSAPTRWQILREHPESIPDIVEELFRFASPSLSTFRLANEDVELGGQIIPKGAMIQVLMGSADHDEAIFPAAETFDSQRGKTNRHIAFGYGPHFCLGAPLARLETRIALEQLSQRLPSLRLVLDQEISYIPSITFHGFKQLLVEWDA